jgi:hypothetical protein
MPMLGRLASATDTQQPQAPHRFVSLQSLTYTGRLWLVLHWQVTVSSDHLCGAEAARGQICVVCKKDSYFSRVGAYGSPGACHSSVARATSLPSSQIPVRLPRTLPMLCAPEIASCGADRARESGTPCAQVLRRAGLRHRRPASRSRLRFTLAKDCCSTSNKEYVYIGPPNIGTLSPGIGLPTECVCYVSISYGLLEQ